MIKSEGVQVGVSWRTIGTIKLEYNTNLHSKDIVKAVLFKLVTSKAPLMVLSNSNTNVFKFTLILQWAYFVLVRKIRLFSHEKVVITQSDACRWFYAPIYARWLPLNCILCWKNVSMNMKWCSLYRDTMVPIFEMLPMNK